MRHSLWLTFFLILIIVGLIVYKTIQHNLPQKKSFSIGLITKETPYHYKVNIGIIKASLKTPNTKFTITPYYAKEQDKMLVAALANQAIENKHDALISVGALCSQVTHQVLKKRLSSIPLVFAGVGDPVKLGIVKSLSKPSQHTTGVLMGGGIIPEAAHKLYQLKQDSLSHLLITFSPNISAGVTEQRAEAYAAFFSSKGIRSTLLPLEKVGEVISTIKKAIDGKDTILIPEACLANDVIHGITKLCNEKGVTLYASELDHVQKGAACGYGADVSTTGAAALEIVKYILVKGMLPSNIPIQELSKTNPNIRKLAINTAACEKQSLNVDLATLPDKENCVIYSTIEPWE